MTFRSLLLGLGLVLLISLGAPYSIWMVGSSEITWSVFPIGVGVPFILLIFVNALLRRLDHPRPFTSAELIVVLSMGLVASGIPIFVAGYILAVISKPYYGATPENEWSSYIQPYLPDWAIPSSTGDAMRYFYEGLPSGEPIPFDAWLLPIFWWMSLILAIYAVCFCLVVLLRKHWVDNERLIFPITEVPRLLIETDPSSSFPPLFRSRAFWLGCAVPLAVILFNIIAYFQPGFPQLGLHRGTPLQLIPGTRPILLLVYFPVIGFMYLVGTAVSFSIWFFYLFTLFETSLVNWAGLTVSRPDAFVWDWQTLSWQAFGAFAAMVLLSLWMSRHHLGAVLRTVFRNSGELDDSEEMLSYRLAVYGGLASALYILLWLWKSGMEIYIAALYLATLLIVFTGMTRLVTQVGMHYLTAPMTAQALPLAIAGTGIAPHSLIALALSHACFGDVESIFMPSAAHAARLGELYRCRRGLAIAIAIAVITSFVATVYFMLQLCYQHGAGNFRSWFFQPGAGAGGIAFDAAVRQLRNPWPTDWGKLAYFGIGGLAYSLLALCQYRFYWWPLHPVGLTVATTWMVRRIALSVFIAWALKTIVLRLGGVALYRQLRPFFIGLVVGFFIGVGISYGVDLIWFFGKGHYILHG